jgi:RNA polymerase subunit RPABC4/transcription elongation factor Spt4
VNAREEWENEKNSLSYQFWRNDCQLIVTENQFFKWSEWTNFTWNWFQLIVIDPQFSQTMKLIFNSLGIDVNWFLSRTNSWSKWTNFSWNWCQLIVTEIQFLKWSEWTNFTWNWFELIVSKIERLQMSEFDNVVR